jgi:CRP-like cAMP-binding protein
MNNNIESIFRVISGYIDINEKEWTYYASMFREKKLKKKEIILKEGSNCRDVFFVVRGLLRVYFVDKEGAEKTFHFALENTFVTDYKSFLKRLPSNFSVQAMEDSTIVLMSYDMLHDGYKKLRFGEKLGRLLAEDYLFIFSDKIQSIYTESPMERYKSMNLKFPKILQRIPQHYIASYLNISSVHLSRLKNTD